MSNEIPTPNPEEVVADPQTASDEAVDADEQEQLPTDETPSNEQAQNIIDATLVNGVLGFVNFDGHSADNGTSGALVSAERRRLFRRDVYVCITDGEQNMEFLGRVVEGPFHTPHEISSDSAITRTTVLHPERTRFRPSYYVYGTIEVLGQLIGGGVVPTPTRPRPYSEISIFPPDRLRTLLDINGDILLGHLMGYDAERIEVRANSQNKGFLPRNVGIFGTVGSGKSNSTQVLIEEAIDAGWAVIVIDVEGEYVRMNEANDRTDMNSILQERFGIPPGGINDFQVYVPSSGETEAAASTRFKVPIAQLSNDVIFDIQEFSEPQRRMFERVVEFARRSNNAQNNQRLGALGPQANRPFIADLNNLRRVHARETELCDDLENLVIKYSGGRTADYTLQQLIDGLGDDNFLRTIQAHERSSASTLRSKLISIGMSGMLDWNGNGRINYLPVNDLLVGGRLSVLDLSETDDRSRNIAIAYVLQSLFEKVIETPYNEPMPSVNRVRPKVLVVIEEVHTFVSRQSVNKMRAVLDNLQTISRRGRKRWMALTLVSQQPGHVPDELFELANTRVIHQLKSAANLAPVRQTTGGVHEALWATIPSLGPGQCLLAGSTFKNPLFVNMRPARSRRMLTS